MIKRPGEEYGDELSTAMVGKAQFFNENPYIHDSKSFKKVKTVTFQVTEDCNLACKYCYQICKSKQAMTLETGKQFIDTLFKESYIEGSFLDCRYVEGIILEFIGGEPLLKIDLIDELTEYFKQKAIELKHPWLYWYRISFISNGVLYFQPKVQEYFKKNEGRISFSISIDGCKDLHDACRVFPDGRGSYDMAVKAAMHYKEHWDKNMLTKMTISPENVTYTFEAIKNLINLGYPVINANCVYEEGWNVEHARILYSECKKIADYLIENSLLEKVCCTLFEEQHFQPMHEEENDNYCGSTGCMLACNPSGGIFPCIRFMKSSLGNNVKEIRIGDINNGIGKLQEDKENIEYLDSITRRSQSTDECFNCPIAAGCGWCSGYNYQTNGTINKRCTFTCIMHKARALANVYFWNKAYNLIEPDKKFEMYIPKEWALEIISEEEYNMLVELAK